TPVPTAYSRVTLVNGTRRVDLALPGALPLADVMPQLLRFCAPEEDPRQPVSWTLGRLGGPSFSLGQSLQDVAVADGEVLEIRPASAVVRSAYVEDVRDAVEDVVDESGRQWRSRTTVGFALAVAAAGLTAATLLPEARAARDAATLAAAVGVGALGVLAGWWAQRSGYPRAALAVLATACLWGGLAGWLASTYPRWPVAASLGAGLAGGLVVAGVARAVTTAATAHLAAIVVLAVAGVPVGLLALAGYSPMTAVRVAAVFAVLLVGILPRTSLAVGGLAGADYRVRNFGLVTAGELAARIRQGTALLHGGIAGVSVAGLAAGLVLTTGASTWDRLLGLCVGLALVLRSRVFSRVPHILPLRTAGLVVLVAQALRAVREDPGARPWLVVLAALLTTVLVVLSAVPLSDVARARFKQVLNVTEMTVVVAMVAVAAGALGIYSWVGQVTG
ncbi:MAG TPA: type VII secretion integral membrane protein EccD, partial [Micromonosporaceae bacterium]|nr:type VII secretion integral membrane protein EccD [Micromonosporaceae bacterium]